MTWFPRYKLYASDGLTLVHEFEAILSDNSPQDLKKSYEVEGSRGQGSIIVSGSDASWDLNLRFHLKGTNYQDLIAKMDLIQSTIVTHTKYIIKIDRTPSSSQSYHVIKNQPIIWDDGKRVTYQLGTIIFRVNSW